MIRKLFFLGLMLIPFSDVKGLSFMGEVQNEPSAYVFLLALLAAAPYFLSLPGTQGVRRESMSALYLLPKIMFLVAGVVIVSAVSNFPDILETTFKGRVAPEKFVSAAVLVAYGFALSFLTYYLAGGRWQDFIARPLAVSVFICAAFSVFEIASNWFNVANGVYDVLFSLFHSGSPAWEWDPRLRSVAFEPPWFGNYAGFVWPWIFWAYRSGKGGARNFYFVAWMTLNVLIALSMARTAFLIVGGSLFVFLALRFVYLPPRLEQGDPRTRQAVSILFACCLALAVLAYMANLDFFVETVVASDSITNLSRLSSIVAAFDMFKDNPFLGLGLGQYGFHVQRYLPFWGYYSYEFKPMLTDPLGSWPSSYSVFARFAAELGLVGLVMWLGLWFGLTRTFIRNTLAYQAITGRLPSVVFPLVVSCFCVLLGGLATETVRFPLIWVTLGLGCRYLAEIRTVFSGTMPAAAVVQSADEQKDIMAPEAGVES
ncbi:MAG: O-antigen ligase family protein [Alphaproteobacteria bacterium]|nr:O-antigen ligase family protein [Alphaproteobacteria bacterium]